MNDAHGARLRIDPWGMDYDSSWNVDSAAETSGTVDLGVEVHGDDWQPLSASGFAGWPELIFLDGGRRMEARVHLEDADGHIAHGGLGSTAVGAVRIAPGERASFCDELRIDRWCLLTSGGRHAALELLQRPGWSGNLRYELHSFEATDAASVMQ